MEKISLFLLVGLLSSAAWACKLAPLNSCTSKDKVRLEKSTFSRLETDVKKYQRLLDQHLKKTANKANKKISCFDYHFSGYYFEAIRDFSKKNRGYLCTQHLPLLYSSINGLVDQKSTEKKLIKIEQAKMDLLEQAIAVSEALLYFKNKHTK